MTLELLSDDELVRMAKEGSLPALEKLICRYQKPLFNFILRMVNNRQTAEDILQECFLKLVKSLPRYRPGNFKSYIYKLTNNLVFDTLRKKRYEISLDASINPQDEDSPSLVEIIGHPKEISPEALLENIILKEKLANAISSLPELQRQVFVLHEYSGLSFKEISRICNCSINTVLARMSYAIKKLRKILTE